MYRRGDGECRRCSYGYPVDEPLVRLISDGVVHNIESCRVDGERSTSGINSGKIELSFSLRLDDSIGDQGVGTSSWSRHGQRDGHG